MSRLKLHRLSSVLAVAGAVLMTAVQSGANSSTAEARPGGIFRVTLAKQDFDYIDPALSYTVAGWALLDTTCARLMAYPDKAPPAAFRLEPEVAAGFPRASRDAKTWTFTLRSGFRFNNGRPVRASAFARAINRTLAPGVTSPAAQYTKDIIGAENVQAGKAPTATGVVARGNTLIVRFKRPVPDFAARTTMPSFCAVPPTLPSDPEGVGAFPAAGPYYVADYRPGERVAIRRNRYYGGKRPHHVDGFDVDLQATTQQEVLDRVERHEADWGYALGPVALEPGRGLVAKYGINKSRFFVKPGYTLRMLVFNSSRPLFRNNPRLRRAVNFALNRRALAGAVNSLITERSTDQYLPPDMPGFRDAHIYPLDRTNLRRARELARGNTRGGKATFYVPNFPPPLAIAQLVKQQLKEIGLDVKLKPIPFHITSSGYLGRLGLRGEPWDISLVLKTDVIDPYGYINLLLDERFIGSSNLARFKSSKYNRLMRHAAGLHGVARYRAYGKLDVQLARDPAPHAAIGFLGEATLVSKRVGCIVLRPVLDLTAVCLK